jgi:IS30 family transposase
MSNCLKNNLPFLKLLKDTESEEQRQGLLETATPSQIRSLTEICHHTLYGYLNFNKASRQKLRKNKKLLRKVASPSRTFKSKRRFVSQSGGGIFSVLLPILLSTVLPALIK